MSLVMTKSGKPFMYLGDWHLAANIHTLRSMGVTHLLNCAKEIPVYYSEGKTLHLEMDDTPSFPIDEYFYNAISFIEKALKEDGVVYVHCAMGISRSATIVLAYMVFKGMKLKDAIPLLKGARPIVRPNPGFYQHLLRYSGENIPYEEMFRS